MAHKGTRFLKTDFQIHSPRDNNWDGLRPEDNNTDIGQARRQWAREFIHKCRECGLQAVAFTDHHEGVYQWYVLDELREMKQANPEVDIWIFPGMELTAKDSAQALLLFDADIDIRLFEKARNLLKLPVDCQETSSTGITVELLDFNIDELQGQLQSDDELKNKFILFPNVTPGGHKTVMRKGFHKRFKDMPYVAGYLDRKYLPDLEPGDRRILEGEIPAWSTERRGVISTSDSRFSDYRLLGKHATWIKLAHPTAESIRQAMLAADSRIRYEEPVDPDVYIHSISIKGADFLSLEKIHFSPQYNAIIGGRGAGKSTLLEYLRFVLGRSAYDIESSKWDPTHDRRRDLLDEALNASTGEIQATVSVDGALIKLLRKRTDPDRIEMEVNDQSRNLTAEEVRDLIQVQTFNQGELSHLGREQAEKRLLELITDPRRSEFEAIEGELKRLSQQIAKQLDRRVEGWNLQQRIRQREAEIATLQARITAQKESLAQAPDQAQSIIELHATYIKANDSLNSARNTTEESGKELLQAFDSYLGSLTESIAIENPPIFAEIDTVLQSTKATLEEVRRLRSMFEAVNSRLSIDFEQAQSQWVPKQEAHNRDYESLVQALAGRKQQAETILRLEEELDTQTKEKSQAEKEISKLSDAQRAFDELVGEYISLQEKRMGLTGESLETVEPLSGGLAKAELLAQPDMIHISKALDHLFAGTYIHQSKRDSLNSLVQNAKNPLQQWWAIILEAIEVFKAQVDGRGIDKLNIPNLKQTVEDRVIRNLFTRISQERVNELIKAWIDPRLKIVQVRDGREIDFSRASQGERATTLLKILMNQSGGPLLIDQPEEDLDNKIINEIVESTRAAKDKRQLIFATHNANLVVNGDAELVLNLDSGQLYQEGAIDHAEVRESITATMEGGKDAFELRRRKYNF